MKKIQHLSFFFLLVSAPVLWAQPGGDGRPKHEKVEELKIAFITTELNLSSEEAQKFWPVYNEMSDKMKVENRKQREITKELHSNVGTYTDADFQKKSEAFLDSGIREAELKKEYYAKIADVIGYKKATKLLSLEQRFKKELLDRLKSPEGGPERPSNGRPN